MAEHVSFSKEMLPIWKVPALLAFIEPTFPAVYRHDPSLTDKQASRKARGNPTELVLAAVSLQQTHKKTKINVHISPVNLLTPSPPNVTYNSTRKKSTLLTD
jgi:hypothetical protein